MSPRKFVAKSKIAFSVMILTMVRDLPMLSRSGYQEDLPSSLVVGQQLGNVPPRGLQVPVHRDGQPAVLTAAPHPRAQDGVLGVCRGIEQEEGACQETGKVTL